MEVMPMFTLKKLLPFSPAAAGRALLLATFTIVALGSTSLDAMKRQATDEIDNFEAKRLRKINSKALLEAVKNNDYNAFKQLLSTHDFCLRDIFAAFLFAVMHKDDYNDIAKELINHKAISKKIVRSGLELLVEKFDGQHVMLNVLLADPRINDETINKSFSELFNCNKSYQIFIYNSKQWNMNALYPKHYNDLTLRLCATNRITLENLNKALVRAASDDSHTLFESLRQIPQIENASPFPLEDLMDATNDMFKEMTHHLNPRDQIALKIINRQSNKFLSE